MTNEELQKRLAGLGRQDLIHQIIADHEAKQITRREAELAGEDGVKRGKHLEKRAIYERLRQAGLEDVVKRFEAEDRASQP